MEKVENRLIALDYKKFENLEFKDCKFTYKGGQPPAFINCSFSSCEWVFEGDALNTLNLLRSLGQEKVFQEIVVKDFLGFK